MHYSKHAIWNMVLRREIWYGNMQRGKYTTYVCQLKYYKPRTVQYGLDIMQYVVAICHMVCQYWYPIWHGRMQYGMPICYIVCPYEILVSYFPFNTPGKDTSKKIQKNATLPIQYNPVTYHGVMILSIHIESKHSIMHYSAYDIGYS